MRRGYADSPHGQIHYIAAGSGEPVLFLHQNLTSSEEFALVLPILATKYRAIAMDTLGSGESDQPSRRYGVSDYADSVVSFLDALDIARASIIGHHTGAVFGVDVAATHPERVDKLVLSGFPLFTKEELVSRLDGRIPDYLSSVEPLVYKDDGSHLTAAWNLTKSGLDMAARPLDEIHSITMAMLKTGPRNYEPHVAIWHYDARAKLPLIKSPTLILKYDKDRFGSRVEAIEEMMKLIPRCRVATVTGGGAYCPRNAPKAFAETIMAFLCSRDA